MGAASVALALVVVTMAAGAFTVLQRVFPWMTLTETAEVLTRTDDRLDPDRLVPEDSDTPADELVTLLADLDPTSETPFATWEPSQLSRTLTATSFGFGCDPTSGLAPVTSASRTWAARGSATAPTSGAAATGSTAGPASDESPDSTLAVTLSAYPAGGGAVAYASLVDAAAACETAYVTSAPADLGVASAQVQTKRVTAVVWTRGDVVVVVYLQRDGFATDASSAVPVLARVDEAVRAGLESSCADPEASTTEVVRSPYLSPARYEPLSEVVEVPLPDTSGKKTARDLTNARPLDDLQAQALESIPAAPVLPATPAPAPTRGPSTLPSPVASPVSPSPPVEPVSVGSAARAVADKVGPGCGWRFTDQVQPFFNDEQTQRDFAQAQRSEQRRLLAAWKGWQRARATYWEAMQRYAAKVAPYADYVDEVMAVSAAWSVIEEARAVYEVALQNYLDAVSARDAFNDSYDAALTDYQAQVHACEQQPSQTPTPTSSPTESASATPRQSDRGQSHQGPSIQVTRRDVTCPPTIPPILSSSAPTVPASPTPAADAQLPVAR